MLLALSVVGRVELAPADPLDSRVAAAFDAHQRRMTADGRLLGPDAVAAAADGFRRRGAEVLVRPSPWRLGAARGRPGGGVAERLARRRRSSRTPSWPPTPSLCTQTAGAGASRTARRHRRPRRPAGGAVTTARRSARTAWAWARAGGRRRDARRRRLAPRRGPVPRRRRARWTARRWRQRQASAR